MNWQYFQISVKQFLLQHFIWLIKLNYGTWFFFEFNSFKPSIISSYDKNVCKSIKLPELLILCEQFQSTSSTSQKEEIFEIPFGGWWEKQKIA